MWRLALYPSFQKNWRFAMKIALIAGLVVFAGCRGQEKGSEADAQAVKRYQADGEFVIQAQKPDDITIKDVSSRGLTGTSVPFRLANGKEGTLTMMNNHEVSLISVRQALADGAMAALTGQAMRDVLVIPKVNGKTHPDVALAKSEGWRIDQIRTDLESVATIEGIKIYCPWKIVFKKKDGSPKTVELPSRSSCQSVLNELGANVMMK
jgi:hypothetical protein